jgi:FixJ family two-component response regulator
MEAIAYGSAQEFLGSYDASRAGCLVLDLSMPGQTGLELQKMLADKAGAPPIIFVTGQGDIPSSVQAMRRGAVEFLTKPVDDGVLLDVIRDALEKDQLERSARSEREAVQRRFASLTPRESEVLRHVISGRLNKQIAGDLGTVEKTIKVHRSRLMAKLQVRSVAALVRLAAQAGITPLG